MGLSGSTKGAHTAAEANVQQLPKTEDLREGAHGDNIAQVHASLFSRGILTKSMVKLFLLCPEKFRQQYVEGNNIDNTFHLSVGKAGHDTLEEAGIRQLAGETFSLQQARRFMANRWDHHMDGVELIDCTRDSKLAQMMDLYQRWTTWQRQQIVPRFGKMVKVEAAYGYDGDIMLGDTPIAGHLDTEWENGVTDFKIVKSTSTYRKPVWLDLERIMYAVMTGKRNVHLITMVHNFKRMPKDGPIELIGDPITDLQIEIAANIVGEVAANIKAGRFPPTQEVMKSLGSKTKAGKGLFPCSADWCDWFGQCKITKGMPTSITIRED